MLVIVASYLDSFAFDVVAVVGVVVTRDDIEMNELKTR